MAKASTSKQLTVWEEFQVEIQNREQEISGMLPGHVSKKRFLNSAISAVKQTPGLLKATKRSLFGAITKSAQDGLLPDGREGVITVYREKQRDGSYLEVAQWNPMTFGLRKRARELDQILVDAQVVYENDHFVWHQGDEPKLEHNPAPLGTDRGAMIGAYAIFRDRERNILHREVMDKTQIEAVKGQSKAPNGLLWTKFEPEAWRKTVVRRGFKSVPCSERLQTVVTRDDDMFAFDPEPGMALPHTPPSKAWHGPLKITELKSKMRSFAGELYNVTDESELDGLLESYKDVLEQCKRDLPDWYLGTGDALGVEEEVKNKRHELMDRAAIEGSYEPVEDTEPEPKITLYMADGEIREFGQNAEGALYAIAELEDAVEEDENNWEANKPTAEYMAQTWPDAQANDKTPTLKKRVEALRRKVESNILAAG